jgi:integrase
MVGTCGDLWGVRVFPCSSPEYFEDLAMKLTQKTIGGIRLPAGKSEHVVFDEDLPGFGLRIRGSGARSWVYQCKIGRRNRRVTIGSVSAVSPARARATANEMHAKARLGIDPGREKIESRTQASLSEALRTYLAHQRTHVRWRTYVEVERHLLKNCKSLHSLPLAKIGRRDIATLISAIATGSGNVTANRVRASLAAFFAWAMREGLLDNNPVIGTNRQPEKSRERVLSDDELKIIWDALGASDYSTVVRLLMLTGQRTNEIGSLRWSEIIDDRIVLPSARTKNGREHTIPLVPFVQSMFVGRQRGDEFVFGSRFGSPFRGWSICKAALDQRISDTGTKLEHWTHHDLRRTMATRMAESGTAPHIIEAILNHISGHKAGVAGIYNRASYEPQKRIALEKWAEHVEALVKGKRPAKVVKLHRV